jgi:hypothetical protein
MRLRFTIARMMGVVLVIAVGLAAWQIANNTWANIVFNVTVLVLIVATYNARFAPGKAGAWWLGFATLGWAHLVLWLCGRPWAESYSFNLSVVTDLVYFVLSANVGFDQLASSLSRDLEPAKARTVLMECATTLIVGLIGAWSFFLAALVRTRAPNDHATHARVI